MATLTADRTTPRRSQVRVSLLVAAGVILFSGAMVGINASGYAVPAGSGTAVRTLGVCIARADNTTGLAGAIRVMVERSTWQFNNSAGGDAITAAAIGTVCYAVDDNTVALTSNSGARTTAGIVRDVDSAGVWVEF